MRTTIDRFGRLVVPKEIRDRHGLVPGATVEIEDLGETIVLRQLEEMPGLVEKDGLIVFRGRATGDVQFAVRQHRLRRLQGHAGVADADQAME